jgi:hypothetical protein
MTTSAEIVNQALQIIGDNSPNVTGNAPNFDSSPAGKAAAALYAPCVATVMRSFEFDFTRHTVALVATGNAAPYPWALEYTYPADAIQVWQLSPQTETDPNDPLPVDYVVANAIVAGTQSRVIHTNLASAQAIYDNYPNENLWESTFREAVVRLLASELALALAGKPDLSQSMLESAGSFETVATQRGN